MLRNTPGNQVDLVAEVLAKQIGTARVGLYAELASYSLLVPMHGLQWDLTRRGVEMSGHLMRWPDGSPRMKKIKLETAISLFPDKTVDDIRKHVTAVGFELSETDARGGKKKTDALAILRKVKAVLMMVNAQVDRDYKDRPDQKEFHLGLLLNGLKSICEKHGLNLDVVMSNDIVKKHIDNFTPENLPSLKLGKASSENDVANSIPVSEELISEPASGTEEHAVVEEAVSEPASETEQMVEEAVSEPESDTEQPAVFEVAV
jgi:hypothetical protein